MRPPEPAVAPKQRPQGPPARRAKAVPTSSVASSSRAPPVEDAHDAEDARAGDDDIDADAAEQVNTLIIYRSSFQFVHIYTYTCISSMRNL
jgi:hypothetical protein